MHIELNGEKYLIPDSEVDRLVDTLWGIALGTYETKLDEKMKTGLMVVSRGMLLKSELEVRARHGKEASLALRPPKKSDPTLFLAQLMLPHVRKGLENACISCEVDPDEGTATAFTVSIPRESLPWGQVDTTGDERMWENNGSEIS